MINLSELLTRRIEAMNANDFTDESFALSAAVQMQERKSEEEKSEICGMFKCFKLNIH